MASDTPENVGHAAHREWVPNALGVAAILLWSSTVGFSRWVLEPLGIVVAVACQYLLAGALLCVIEAVRFRGLHRFREIPRSYLIVCGLFFVCYMSCLFSGIGMAAGRRQAVEVGLLNYLWPALVVVFSVPILRYRARWGLLIPGALMGFAGAGIACLCGGQEQLSLATFLRSVRSSPIPYLLGISAGVLWGLYSNFVRRLGNPRAASGTPLFALAAGLLFLLSLPFSTCEREWSLGVMAAVIYLGVFPGALGYVFWEIGMKKGNVVLLGSLSFFTPVLSTLISCAFLGVPFGMDLLVGCVFVTAGAWACKAAVKEDRRSRIED